MVNGYTVKMLFSRWINYFCPLFVIKKSLYLQGCFIFFMAFPLLGYASNTAVNGVAARAESMQAFTAVADDSSAIYYNPAGLTQVKGTEIYNTIAILNPSLTYINSITHQKTTSQQMVPGGSLFISTDKVNHVTLGFGIYSPFAQLTHYSPNLAVYDLKHKAKLLRLDAVPTIAYQVTPQISLGLGLVASTVKTHTNILGFKEHAKGHGFTGQAGVLVKLPKNINLGLTYRARESVKMHGTGSLGEFKDHFDAGLHFPAVASMGAAAKLTEQFLVSFAYDYEMWSYLEKVQRKYSNPLLNSLGTAIIDGKNVGIYRLGALYKINPDYEFRAGYSYSPRAIPKDNIIPAEPDYDTNFFSLGISRYYDNWRFDATYEYAHGDKFINNNVLFPGTYHAHNNIVMLGVTYTFPSTATPAVAPAS